MKLANYLRWRIAANRFGKFPWELDRGETIEVERQAEGERRVIERALASPRAAEVRADAEVVEAAVAALSQQTHDFAQALARGGLDGGSLRDAIAAELRAGITLELIGDAATVSESQVRAYYARNRQQMKLPERRLARHILITINEAMEESLPHIAARRVDEAVAALAAGEEFGKVALRLSECPSAMDGGRLGEMRRGQLYPEIEAVLFALAPGASGVAQTELGFHLVFCEAVIPEQSLSYQQAAPSIRRRLESLAKKRLMQRWLAEASRLPETASQGKRG